MLIFKEFWGDSGTGGAPRNNIAVSSPEENPTKQTSNKKRKYNLTKTMTGELPTPIDLKPKLKENTVGGGGIAGAGGDSIGLIVAQTDRPGDQTSNYIKGNIADGDTRNNILNTVKDAFHKSLHDSGTTKDEDIHEEGYMMDDPHYTKTFKTDEEVPNIYDLGVMKTKIDDQVYRMEPYKGVQEKSSMVKKVKDKMIKKLKKD